MAFDETRQISVSRDALRADLAEMELRLRTWISTEVALKANQAEVDAHDKRLAHIEAGDLTAAQRRAVTQIIDDRSQERSNQGWTTRDRWIGALLALIAVASFVVPYVAPHA